MSDSTPVFDLDPDLSMLTVEQLLRRAVVLEDNEELSFAVGRAARRELDLVVKLGELVRPGDEPGLGDVTPVLESVDRKLAVAMELMRRRLSQLQSAPPVSQRTAVAVGAAPS